MTERSFPPGFLWGAAHAGHQVEGDNDNSDTWFAEHVTPTVFKEPSGKACNSYELWREDVDLAKGLGLNAYRFSVEWARVEPVEGKFSDERARPLRGDRRPLRRARPGAGGHLQPLHRAALVRDARAAGSTPRRPRSSPATATGSMERFGDRIAYAVTMNEPNLTRLLTWLDAARLHPDARAGHAGRSERGRRRAGVPPGQRDAPRGDGRLGGRDGRGPRRRAGRDQGPPRRPAGRLLARDHGRRRGRRRPVGARPQARRGLRALARARPGRRLRRRAELRADALTTATAWCRRPRTRRRTRWARRSSRSPWPARSATPTRSPASRCWSPSTAWARADDALRAAFIEPSLARAARRDRRGRPGAGLPATGRCSTTSSGSSATATSSGCTRSTATTFVRTPKPSAGVYAAIVRAGAVSA